MTGFGKSVVQLPGKKITIEIKSLNSKNLDLNARIPSTYREKELVLRNMVAKALERGKIDVSLFLESTGENTNTVINESVVHAYSKQLQAVTPGGMENVEAIKIAMRLPDALKTERDELDENEYQAIVSNLKQALSEINTYRLDEGNSLKTEFELRIANLQRLLEEVITLDVDRLDDVKTRLQKAVVDLKAES